MMRIAFAEHQHALADPTAVDAALRALVKELAMRVLAGPLVAEETGPPEKTGVSGVVILYESHIAIHTYPCLREAFVDVFSCKPYDPKLVAKVLASLFGQFSIIEETYSPRGIHWNASVQQALSEWSNLR